MISTGAFLASGQQSSISGTVTDADDGTTLPGVTVHIKGTQQGVATDINGRYSIEVSQNDVLIFTFVGYSPQEITPGNRTVIDVSLKTDIQELSEIVVVGYGQVEKGDVTGVVNKIDEKQFNKGMLTSPEQLIAGKVAGVQITSNSGEPGGGISIRIRGGSSLQGGSDPLYVVDGIPLEKGGSVAGTRNPLSFINPADIADITILKDASAAAIYGSRAASGVVIITTKSGQSGKPQFTYDGAVSVSSIVDKVSILSAPEFVFTVERKGPRNITKLGYNDVLYNTDWMDEVLQTAIGQNHNLSASFGIKKNTTARVSVNYQNLDGILNTSNTQRLAGSLNLTHKMLNNDLKIKLNTKHSMIDNRFAPNVVGSALIYAPTQPIRIDDGSYFQWTSPLAPLNPVSQIANTFNIGRSKRNLVGINLDYNIPFVDGLSAKVNYAIDRSDGLSQVTNYSLGRSGDLGGYSYFEDFTQSNLFESYINYVTDVPFGKIDVLAGYSYQDFERGVKKSYRKVDTVSVDDLNVTSPTEYFTLGELDAYGNLLEQPLIFDETENRLISFWGRANVTIKDRYLITATIRRDGSTRFAPSNRWGIFPSLAVGWRIIDESFMSGATNIFSNLKARFSYGVTGNQDIQDYAYIGFYQYGDDKAQYIFGQDTVSTVRPNAVDPDIKWEETASWNAGLDFGFLDGRLTGSVDMYKKVTSDLLLNITFPIGQLPGDQAITNVAEFESKGVEFLFNSILVDKSDLRVDVTLNAAYNKNEILKLNKSANAGDFGIQTGEISGDVGQSIQILRVGRPNPAFLVYQHRRDANGNPIPDGEDVNGDGLKNDLDMFIDQNDDDIINENDLIAYKQSTPDWIFGLTSNVAYKKWDLAMTLRGSLGNYAYNNVFSQYGAYEGVDNVFSPNNIHLSAYTNDFTEKQLLSDIYIENASFLKLDNITVGYSFSQGSLFDARAYFTASNLLAISGYSGIDPESGGISGIDNNLYPRSRTFVLGLNLTF
jgi:iron complex outermembrane receptor protein